MWQKGPHKEGVSESENPRFGKRHRSQSRAPKTDRSKLNSNYILPGIFAVSVVCSSRSFSELEFWLDGNRVHALLVSGSAISLVKKNIYDGRQIKQLKFKLSDIQGKRIQLDRQTELTLELSPHVMIKHKFAVIEGLMFETTILIGLDFLGKNGANVDWQQGIATVAGISLRLQPEFAAKQSRAQPKGV